MSENLRAKIKAESFGVRIAPGDTEDHDVILVSTALELVEAASEKYRQSRKSLRERVEASPYQGEASEFPPSAKVIGVRAVLELLDMDAKSPEEAKPEENSK